MKRKLIIDYDDKGKMIKRSEYDADGKLEQEDVLKYAGNGNLIELVHSGIDGYRKYLYKHDDKKNLIETAEYNSDGRLIDKLLWKYGDKGICIGCIKSVG